MCEIFKLFIFLIMIDLFLSVRHSCNFKILFLFLGKKPQTGENNPSFLKKIKRNFHKAPKSGTISQFPPLIYKEPWRSTEKWLPICCSSVSSQNVMKNQVKQCKSLQTAERRHCTHRSPHTSLHESL